MARLFVQFLALTLLCIVGMVSCQNEGFEGDLKAGIVSNGVARRHLLANLTLPPNLPITLPAGLLNLTTARAYNFSSINQTLIISQLRVPANLTAALGLNVTTQFVNRLVTQTLPLVLACSSNATERLYVCFKTWESVFNASYMNVTEEAYRYTVFVNNTKATVAQNIALVRYFSEANKTQLVQLFLEDQLPPNITTLLNSTTLLGFTKYNDRTIAELGRRFSGSLPNDTVGVNTTAGSGTVGARRMLQSGSSNGKASWVRLSNPIRDQGQCGFCWVFAVTGSLEIVNNIVAGDTGYAFSDEEIIDCLGAPCDQGGFAQWSSWVPKNKRWGSQSAGPYEEDDGRKSECPTGSPGNWFTSLMQCKYSWEDWKRVLDVQPTLFYVHADDTFQNLQGNTIINTQCSSQRSNHVMVAVGYDSYRSSSGDVYEYVIFRNSWGVSYGANGYGKFAMTKNGRDLNLCATTSKGIVFHANQGIPLPSLSGCQSLSLSNNIR